ncbi:MAG: hypothetical protein WCB68_04460 [Pyrinomonadaceae bacterium]
MNRIGALSVFLLIIASPVSAQRAPDVSAQLAPDDCSWQSGGGSRSGSRKALKLRTADEGKGYTKYNRGKPITIDQWFEFTCGLDGFVPREIPVDQPIKDAETIRVTLRGYVLAARFMRDGDHDINVELGATPDWNTDHVVVEMSAGTQYCAARKALWKLVRKDGCQEDQCILRKPVEVLVTGYVLVGNPPQGVTDYCHLVAGRGMRKGEQAGRVRGLWRLQPVLSVKKI